MALAALLVVGPAAPRLEPTPLPVAIYALNGIFPFALALQAGLLTAALIGAVVMALFALSPALVGRPRPGTFRQPVTP